MPKQRRKSKTIHVHITNNTMPCRVMLDSSNKTVPEAQLLSCGVKPLYQFSFSNPWLFQIVWVIPQQTVIPTRTVQLHTPQLTVYINIITYITTDHLSCVMNWRFLYIKSTRWLVGSKKKHWPTIMALDISVSTSCLSRYAQSLRHELCQKSFLYENFGG